MFNNSYTGSGSNFKTEFDKKRNKIRNFVIAIFVIVIGIIILQFGAIYYGFTKVEENGGFQKTATDILRTIKQIDKDSDK